MGAHQNYHGPYYSCLCRYNSEVEAKKKASIDVRLW